MIDRKHKLPVAHQCSLLGVARSSAYYRPREVSPEDLALMRSIDELPIERLFTGARMVRDLLGDLAIEEPNQVWAADITDIRGCAVASAVCSS